MSLTCDVVGCNNLPIYLCVITDLKLSHSLCAECYEKYEITGRIDYTKERSRLAAQKRFADWKDDYLKRNPFFKGDDYDLGLIYKEEAI